MPRLKRRAWRKFRRGRRSGRSGNLPRVQRSRFSTLAPAQTFVRLEYTDTYVNAAAATVNRVYAYNDLFDPNVTGVGVQPVGFDQWCALYGRYEVVSCRVVHELYNNATANIVLMVVYPTLSTTAVTGTADAAGQPRALTLRTSGTSGVPFASRASTYKVATLIGRNTYSLNFTGSSGASPANRVYLQYLIASLDGATVMNITLRVRMLFNVRFYEQINLDRS